MTVRVSIFVFAMLSSLAACSNRDANKSLPADQLRVSEHFRYHSRTNDDTCEQVLGDLERHFSLLQAYLGFAWPSGRTVDYFKFLDAADFARNNDCERSVDACAVLARESPAIESPRVLDAHE